MRKNIQALLNEQKGYVFEYLVSRLLSEMFNLSIEQFLGRIEAQHLDRLEQYQREIYAQDKCLYVQLPHLAEETATYIYDKYKKLGIESVLLCSREKGGGSADIILKFINRDPIEISLKFCKNHSFINTKSAGVKSFFVTYFENAKDIQNKFNQTLFSAFEKMRFSLLENTGVDLSSHQFEQWRTEGNTSLPGELDVALRSILTEYYFDSIQALYLGLIEATKRDELSALKSLIKLFGFSQESNKNHIHIFCLHDGTSHYNIAQIVEMDNRDILGQKVEIIPPSRGNAYFLVNYNSVTLQIRVKPMRDFTAPSMKVNCAIKFSKGNYE